MTKTSQTIYLTQSARKSHAARVDELVRQLASSEGIMRDLGYEATTEVLWYLRTLANAIWDEYRDNE